MRDSIFTLGLFTNTKLIWATLISFVLQISVVYIPAFQVIFKTQSLTGFDWILVLVISSFPLLAMELVKLITRLFRKED